MSSDPNCASCGGTGRGRTIWGQQTICGACWTWRHQKASRHPADDTREMQRSEMTEPKQIPHPYSEGEET